METEADLSDFLWAFVWIAGYKVHFVPKKLVADVISDLQNREHEEEGAGEIVELKGVESGWCDRPGMIMTDRPIEHIRIDTFTLDIPSQDFQYFARKLQKAQERRFPSGEKYYKIHGWLHCVVFTPDQRKLLLQTMKEMWPGVHERAEAADKEFSRRMRELNKADPEKPKVISHRDKESPYIKKIPKPKKEDLN
jgi:hypothetical protein